jgi:transcriptional regulator with XRE-family HTH domain
MSSEARSFKELFEWAEQYNEYWTEGAIIQFTEDLALWMERRGWSRADLAREMGVSQAYITKILKGNANFTLASMTKIARVLGARLDVRLLPADAPYPVREENEAPSPPSPEAARPQPAGNRRGR